MQALGAGYGATLPPTLQHSRSVSLSPPQASPSRLSVSKAKSTTALRTVAQSDAEQEDSFHTLQDPRTASTSDLSRTGSTSSRQAGLDMEVAALSDKLISAINHQQTLDDTLAHTRHELETARKRLAEMEAKERDREANSSRSQMVRKVSVERMKESFNAQLASKELERSQAQQDKKKMESQLEDLTVTLFEDANTRVADIGRKLEAAEKRNQQLREQLKDEEAIITFQNEQLSELKSIMQQAQSDNHKDSPNSPRVSLDPTSPKTDSGETNLARLLEAMDLEPLSPDCPIAPSPATRFTHLIKAQCRVDIPAYDDFKNMIQTGNPRSHTPSHAPSRAGSGSYSGLNVMGLGSSYNTNNSSSPNLGSQPRNDRTPAVPGSFSPNADFKGPTLLKETRFFKRIMQEDIEPTLRMDLSPTISWLNRRTLLAAFADSTLIVEPIPEASLKLYGKYTPCNLCGESRKEGQNPRTHAMRTKEGESAQKWPICVLCLEKVRAVGDLVGYIRMVRDGVVKCGDRKEEEEAWDELVRLRERLFWARMAGGVVPVFVPSNKNSPLSEVTESKDTDGPGQGTKSSGFATPDETPRNSQDDEVESAKQATSQLQAGLDESLTTFDNIKDQMKKRASTQSAAQSTPPNTPPSTRESGSFPKISIPRLPQGFWDAQVNTLH